MSAPRGSSLYDLLGVSKTATPTEIKKAYLKLARTHHPDKGGDPEKFKEIAQANEVLTDEIRRRRYDELGVTDDQPTGGSGFPFPFEMNVNIQDLFGNMFQGMGMGSMGMGSMGGGPPGQQVRKGKKPGPTIQTIPVRLEQYYLGHQFDIMIHRQAFCVPCDHTGARVKETCRRCHGSGSLTQVVQMGPIAMHTTGPCTDCQGRGQKMIDSCPVCSGTGFTQQTRKLTVHIPAGTRPMETFIFPEVCSDHVAFEKPGDVHILLQEDLGDTSFKTFRRAGDQFQHLETIIHLTLAESLLGTVVQLDGHPGYDEGLFVEIPAGTFTKDVYALDGLGMPLVREKDKYGELHLMIEVSVSDEERLKMSGAGADVLRQVLGGMVTPANCPAESIQRVARRV